MVTEFGMSDLVGPVNHEGRRRNSFIEMPYGPERGAYAEETAKTIDTEIRRIITTAESLARQILEQRRESLDLIAERLLEFEVIEGEELRALLAEGDSGSAVSPPAAS
jgi:cell division protease FtsH